MSLTDSGRVVARKKSGSSLGRDSLLVGVVGFSAALPFLLAPLRAQVLGPAGRGEFAFFQSSLTTVGVAAALGVRIACYQVQFLAEDRFRISYMRMTIASFISSAVVAAPLFFVAYLQFSPFVAWTIGALVLLAPSFVINQIEFASANYGRNGTRIAGASSVPAIVDFGLSIAAFVLKQYTLIVGIFIAIFAQMVRLLAAWKWHVADRSRIAPTHRKADRSVERNLFVASLRNAPAAIIPLLSGNIDVLIFGVFIKPEILGHYVVAKLGFTALLIAASVLEGRAIRLVTRSRRLKGLLKVAAIAIGLVIVSGVLGWILTPVVFGMEFMASAQAFPLLSFAGGLAFLFVCFSAINAQKNIASVWPGLASLAVLVVGCIVLSQFFGSDIVIISCALIVAQAVGASVVLTQFLKRRGKHL